MNKIRGILIAVLLTLCLAGCTDKTGNEEAAVKMQSISDVRITTAEVEANGVWMLQWPSYVFNDSRNNFTRLDADKVMAESELSDEEKEYLFNYVNELTDYSFARYERGMVIKGEGYEEHTYLGSVKVFGTDEEGKAVSTCKLIFDEYPEGYEEYVALVNRLCGDTYITLGNEVNKMSPELYSQFTKIKDENVQGGTVEDFTTVSGVDMCSLYEDYNVARALTQAEDFGYFRLLPRKIRKEESTEEEFTEYVELLRKRYNTAKRNVTSLGDGYYIKSDKLGEFAVYRTCSFEMEMLIETVDEYTFESIFYQEENGDFEHSAPVFYSKDGKYLVIYYGEDTVDAKRSFLRRFYGEDTSFLEALNKELRKWEPEDISIDRENVPDWAYAYYDYLLNGLDEEIYYEGAALIYLDDDDVPELFLTSDSEAGGEDIITYCNGKLAWEHLGRLGGEYIERSGRILNHNGHMGYYFTRIIELKNGQFTINHYGEFYEDYDAFETLSEGEEPPIKYIWEEKEVTEEEYEASLEKYYDFSKSQYINCISIEEVLYYLANGEYSSANNSYELVEKNVTFKEAYEESIKKGGHLASLTTWDEWEAVYNLLVDSDTKAEGFYVGYLSGGMSDGEYLNRRWINPDGTYTESNSFYGTEYWDTNRREMNWSYDNSECGVMVYYPDKKEMYLYTGPLDLVGVSPQYDGKMGYIIEYEK